MPLLSVADTVRKFSADRPLEDVLKDAASPPAAPISPADRETIAHLDAERPRTLRGRSPGASGVIVHSAPAVDAAGRRAPAP